MVEQVLATNQVYLLATHKMFIAVDKRDTLRAMKIDHNQIDPVFSAMQKQVNTQATNYHAEAMQSLAALTATQQLVFVSSILTI